MGNAAFSGRVFQHFEALDDARAVFREFRRVLIPGGTIFIQLPIYELPDVPFSTGFWAALAALKKASDVKANFGRKSLEKGKLRYVMCRPQLSRSDLVADLEHIGFRDIETRSFQVMSNGSYHDVVLARK